MDGITLKYCHYFFKRDNLSEISEFTKCATQDWIFEGSNDIFENPEFRFSLAFFFYLVQQSRDYAKLRARQRLRVYFLVLFSAQI